MNDRPGPGPPHPTNNPRSRPPFAGGVGVAGIPPRPQITHQFPYMAPIGIAPARLLCYHQRMPDDIFRVNGRASRPMSAVEVRALDGTDILLLGEEKGSTAAPLKRLSERHHALARCLSSGMSEGEAAVTCGYVLSRVSILKADPAFQELLSFYRQSVDSKYLDMHGVLAGLSLDAAMELRERLEIDMDANEKKISVGQLMELTKLGADRTGFGPQSSQLNVNVDLAGRLQAARERVAQRRITAEE